MNVFSCLQLKWSVLKNIYNSRRILKKKRVRSRHILTMSSEAGSYTISTLLALPLALPLAKFGSFLSCGCSQVHLLHKIGKKTILVQISSSKMFLQIQTTPS
jgi:hypothetical protein